MRKLLYEIKLLYSGVVILAVELVRFTGPSGLPIDINPETIISIRTAQQAQSQGHIAPGTNCLLFTVDGKYIPVKEDCETARARLGNKQ